jgi:predicted DNA-binding transcriptional regulator AlpA
MDFEKVLDRLQRRESAEMYVLSELAEIFGYHRNTIENWIKSFGFPPHVPLIKNRRTSTRYWRPDQVIAWTRARQRIEADGADTEEVVTKLVGPVSVDTWHAWIKAGDAPAPKWRQLGTGRDLWDRREVGDWWQAKGGGYMLPVSSIAKRARDPKPARRVTRAAPEIDEHEPVEQTKKRRRA